MSNMIDKPWSDEIETSIENAMQSMFPRGAGQTTHTRVQHHLETVARHAFQAGRAHALPGLMTADDVAEHFQITPRRARALIKNRHERFSIGMKIGSTWCIHRDELGDIAPDGKYRRNK